MRLRAILPLLFFTACGADRGEPAFDESNVTSAGGAADEDAVRPTADGRLEILSRAIVAEGDTRNGRSLLEGPMLQKVKEGRIERQSSRELAFNQAIECEYQNPFEDTEPGGKTPKFNCRHSNGDKTRKLKVKYDAPGAQLVNHGLYGEVIATRLFWALGFPADVSMPVQVRCKGCPQEPWKHTSGYFALQRATNDKEIVEASTRYILETLSRFQVLSTLRQQREGDVIRIFDAANKVVFSTADGIVHVPDGRALAVYDPGQHRLLQQDVGGFSDFVVNHVEGLGALSSRDFVSAVVEAKHLSIPIETFDHEGWSFDADIRHVKPELAHEREELALLAAFVAHADNKAEQQRLVCLDNEKIEAEDDDCKKSGDPRLGRCAPGTDTLFTTCDRPMLMIQDLGFTMGFGATLLSPGNADDTPGARARGTADAQGMADAPLFKDDRTCTTTVNVWVTGVEIAEPIHEASRASLAGKLRRLADDDVALTELFRAGRLHLRELHMVKGSFPAFGHQVPAGELLGGDLEAGIIERFKVAFRTRVAKLESTRCPP